METLDVASFNEPDNLEFKQSQNLGNERAGNRIAEIRGPTVKRTAWDVISVQIAHTSKRPEALTNKADFATTTFCGSLILTSKFGDALFTKFRYPKLYVNCLCFLLIAKRHCERLSPEARFDGLRDEFVSCHLI